MNCKEAFSNGIMKPAGKSGQCKKDEFSIRDIMSKQYLNGVPTTIRLFLGYQLMWLCHLTEVG